MHAKTEGEVGEPAGVSYQILRLRSLRTLWEHALSSLARARQSMHATEVLAACLHAADALEASVRPSSP